MIIRHFGMKSARLSSFASLVNYLTNEQNKQERVGKISISNCHSNEPDWMIQEVLATQARNQRAVSDKTYHLLISFAPDEYPKEEILKAIEKRLVASIGLQDNQRMSVVHHDTDNLHLHVAINKIHPKTFNMIEPYRAYKTFAKVATELEVEYGLTITSHETRKSRSETLADNMEQHSGIESLINWMKKSCQSQIDAANNWRELHQALAEYGLQVRIQANGLVFVNEQGLMIKASSVSRRLSKINLETKLGQFQPSKNTYDVNNKQSYRYAPLNKKLVHSSLYARYCDEKNSRKKQIPRKLKHLRLAKNLLIEKSKKSSQMKFSALMLMPISLYQKKYLRQQIKQAQSKQVDGIRENYTRARKRLLDFYQNKTWADWLRQKAEEGNQAALKALRYRTRKKPCDYSLSGNNASEIININQLDSITKTGTEIYKIQDTVIRKNGDEIRLSKGASIASIKHAIEMARQCYGDCLRVNGSLLFQKVILQVAVQHHIPITFADADMDQQRKQRISQQENIHDRANRFSNGNRVTSSAQTPRATIGKKIHDRAGRSASKPHPASLRQSPPAESQNSLRNLSQLDVVQLASGSKVLLQNHAHDQLERQGCKPDHPVRRKGIGLR